MNLISSVNLKMSVNTADAALAAADADVAALLAADAAMEASLAAVAADAMIAAYRLAATEDVVVVVAGVDILSSVNFDTCIVTTLFAFPFLATSICYLDNKSEMG